MELQEAERHLVSLLQTLAVCSGAATETKFLDRGVVFTNAKPCRHIVQLVKNDVTWFHVRIQDAN